MATSLYHWVACTRDGYTMTGGKWLKNGQPIKFSIEDPSSYTDYAEDLADLARGAGRGQVVADRGVEQEEVDRDRDDRGNHVSATRRGTSRMPLSLRESLPDRSFGLARVSRPHHICVIRRVSGHFSFRPGGRATSSGGGE